MSARISAFHLNPNADDVWRILTQVGAIGRYSDAARAFIMGWVLNARRYSADGRPGELDFEVLNQVEHLRQGEQFRGPCVHPFVNCLHGLLFGVHLTTYEPHLEARVTAQNDMGEPVLTMVFGPDYDDRRIAGFARAFQFELPTLAAPGIEGHSTEVVSNNPSIGMVEINIVRTTPSAN